MQGPHRGPLYSPFSLSFHILRPKHREIRRRHKLGLAMARPIRSHIPQFNVPMKRREWPRMWTKDKAMFYWVVMDVIQVLVVIALIPDEVFPESALPDAATTLSRFGIGNQSVT